MSGDVDDLEELLVLAFDEVDQKTPISFDVPLSCDCFNPPESGIDRLEFVQSLLALLKACLNCSSSQLGLVSLEELLFDLRGYFSLALPSILNLPLSINNISLSCVH